MPSPSFILTSHRHGDVTSEKQGYQREEEEEKEVEN